MPTLRGDRLQLALLPSSLEDYVGSQDRVRAYDAFVEYLTSSQSIQLAPSDEMGRPEYDPKAMLKLLIYSYSYGVRSSRQIERACHHNLSYLWLTGGLKPDHKTISRFRKENLKLIHTLLKQCVHLCVKLKLIDGHVLFVDGTKIRANASMSQTWTQKKCERVLSELDERVRKLLEECEALDQVEQTESSHVQMPTDLADAQTLKQKVQQILEELKVKDQKRINATDPDCAIMKSRQGTHTAYNVQHVVDDKEGLIVSAEAVSDATDIHQLPDQVQNAQEHLEHPPQTVCADAGYSAVEELEAVEKQDIDVCVPSQKQALHRAPKPFHHDDFKYDAQKDCYICPAGQKLTYKGINKPGISNAYRITDAKICRTCPHFGTCTSSHQGRKITRLFKEGLKKHFESKYQSPEGQLIYKRRKEKAEHPFGYIKRLLRADHFLLRGQQGVQAETVLSATCFNLARLITLLGGVGRMVRRLNTT